MHLLMDKRLVLMTVGDVNNNEGMHNIGFFFADIIYGDI